MAASYSIAMNYQLMILFHIHDYNLVFLLQTYTYYSETSSQSHGHQEMTSQSQTHRSMGGSSHSSIEDQTTHGMHGSLSSYGTGRPIVVIQDRTPKGGTCLTWAGVHYKTFDGKIYRYVAKFFLYVLLKVID